MRAGPPGRSCKSTGERASAAGDRTGRGGPAPSAPSSEILTWATVFGILLALSILAMSVGLIRSETASDLRTLAATGPGPRVTEPRRRTVPAAAATRAGQRDWRLPVRNPDSRPQAAEARRQPWPRRRVPAGWPQ